MTDPQPEPGIEVQVANAGRTSAGYVQPGDVVTLPAGEARAMLAAGLARRMPAREFTAWGPCERPEGT